MVSGAIEVANFLKKEKGKSIVISSGGYRESEILRNGCISLKIPLETKNPFLIYRNRNILIEVIKKYSVNIVHARSRAPAWSAFLATKLTKTIFVTTFHGTYGTQNFFKKKYNSVMLESDAIIAISKFIKLHINKEYKKFDKIHVIPRGVDGSMFSPSKVTAERIISVAKKIQNDDLKRTILLPGRLTSWKGHEIAIRAVSLIKDMDLKLIILGDTQKKNSYKNYLLSLVNKLEVQDKILFLDHTRDLPAFMMLSDLVISCSTKPEAFGRIILEAQAMGCPVLAFNHGGSVELIKDNKNGILSKPFDICEFSKNIRKLLSLNTKERKQIATDSTLNVKKKYLTSAMCKKTIKLYKELILKHKNYD